MKGKAKTATSSKNCLLCKKYFSCKDKKKGAKYLCSLYKHLSEETPKRSTKPPKKSKDCVIDDNNNSAKIDELASEVSPDGMTSAKQDKKFYKLISKILEEQEKNPVPTDLKIDDRDLKQAPNFFTFITDKHYLGSDDITPFARQLEYGSKLFAEVCYHCSNKDYIGKGKDVHANEPGVGDSPYEFLENVQLLEYGKCPKCKRTKSEQYKKGKWPVYYALTGLAGQRASKCVTPDTYIHTEKGFKTILDLTGRTDTDGVRTAETMIRVLDEKGTARSLSHTFCGTPEDMYRIVLKNGQHVTGTPVHPLWTTDKFTKIKDIVPGQWITLFLGQDKWPESSLIQNNDGETLALTPELSKFLGYVVGSMRLLTEEISKSKRPDFIDDAMICLAKHFGPAAREFTDKGIRLTRSTKSYIARLIGNPKHYIDLSVPKCIMEGNRANVIEFLSSFFTMRFRVDKKGIYAFGGEILVSQLQILLHNLGIPATVCKHTRQYTIRLDGRQVIDKFISVVGFTSPSRELKLSIDIDHLEKSVSDYDIFPERITSLWNTIVPLINEQLGYDAFTNTKELTRQHLQENYKTWKNIPNKTTLTWSNYVTAQHIFSLGTSYNICFMKVAHKIKTFGKPYDITVPEVERFMGNGLLNHNSTMFSMFSNYMHHGFMKLQNASQFYGVRVNQVLYGQLVALTWKNAIDLLYTPMYEDMLTSEWFSQYHSLLRDAGNRYGEELIKMSNVMYVNRARRLTIAPFGPDKGKLRGKTGYLGAVDEIGLFNALAKKDAVKMNADEVFKSISNSMATIQSAYMNKIENNYDFALPPLLGAISSPMSKRDKIVRLYNEAHNDPHVFCFHKATWEINPTLPRSFFDAQFKNNPVDASRDFGAVPPNSANPYIEKLDPVVACLDKDMKNSWGLRKEEVKVKKTPFFTAKPKTNFPQDNIKRVMALDCARIKNSMAIVTGYYDEKRFMPVIDGICELIPTDGIAINFSLIYDDFIRPLVQYGNVMLVVADQWQGLKTLDDIKVDEGCESEQYSIKYKDLMNFKNDLTAGKIIFPEPEMKVNKIEGFGGDNYPECFEGMPVAHFLQQLLTVVDTNKSIEKGEKTTDDILRAVVLAYSYIVDPDYRYLCSGVRATGGSKGRPGFAGSIGSKGGRVGLSGGSSGSASGGSNRSSYGYVSYGKRGLNN